MVSTILCRNCLKSFLSCSSQRGGIEPGLGLVVTNSVFYRMPTWEISIALEMSDQHPPWLAIQSALARPMPEALVLELQEGGSYTGSHFPRLITARNALLLGMQTPKVTRSVVPL